MFTQEVVVQFFISNEHPKLSEYILELLKRVDQLNDRQVVGLILASFNIGGACWIAAVKLLVAIDPDRRLKTLQLFQLCFCMQYKVAVAEWCCSYWRQMEQQHIDILKYMNTNPTTVDAEILILSLAVVVQDQKSFVSFAADLIVTAPITSMVIDSLKTRPSQSKMTYD